ncbi:hypothetical protein ABBQ38_006004 [Trebouxia sp. C0009 RCD-2024]
MASAGPPAEEFRNTPPETGVGGASYRGPAPILNLVPVRCSKTVHFIRHGEGFHNIGFDANVDAHLTQFGWTQAHALNHHLQTLGRPPDIQLLVVSPLVRTLETATGAFGKGLPQDPSTVMMTALAERPDWQSEHAAVALPGVPVIAHEGCRERVSWSKCDSRRSLSETKAQFPGVDFSLIQSEEDTMWPEFTQAAHRSTFGEPDTHVTERGINFLRWLMDRDESRIAVVSHCGWLFHTLSAFSHDNAPVKSPPISSAAPGMHSQSSELDVDFQNCEMRTMVLTDPRTGPGRGDPAWFPGGQNITKAADRFMHMLEQHDGPEHLVVFITSDQDFCEKIQELQRRNFKVVVLYHGPSTSWKPASITQVADESHDWLTFLKHELCLAHLSVAPYDPQAYHGANQAQNSGASARTTAALSRQASQESRHTTRPSSANSSIDDYRPPAPGSSQGSRMKVCVARDQDFQDQIGSHQWFDLMDPEKVKSFWTHNQTTLLVFKQNLTSQWGIPVRSQRLWLWARCRNGTLRLSEPMDSGQGRRARQTVTPMSCGCTWRKPKMTNL